MQQPFNDPYIRPPNFNAGPTLYRGASSYPTFLSFSETALLHVRWALGGLLDSWRWDIVVKTALADAEIRANILKSTLLNAVSLISIYTFDLLIIPLLGRATQERWLHRNFGTLYQVVWLLPVVGASLYFNSTWSTVIAKRTYVLQYGRRVAASPASYSGMLRAIATSAYRAILLGSSILVTFALGYIPVVGPFASFVYMCWVNSYYCFEFVWVSKGLSLPQRVRHQEERWTYYFSFGLTSAALCLWGSSFANAAIFALLYPAYIMMAMSAHPHPIHPYSPIPPRAHPNPRIQEDVILHPSPFIPIRIPIFAPMIFLNEGLLKIVSIVTGGKGGGKVRRQSESLAMMERAQGTVGRSGHKAD
ncbi:hypothetical protein BOTBODRAFT_161933 [Botryobasidium botryosum FD-172 SS1]|uniref:Etoposide-induced protein 2.4-domain-containing protein n=1 Tax=Botryobasidium botryosum (strain FD-172 SS1) TaxID=930990 RepID=A0A067MLC1_BOTB1|nr:hypothetical protein BOTBODRAFT_161933 [Botryobasidium botryosum FD-172 SS1]